MVVGKRFAGWIAACAVALSMVPLDAGAAPTPAERFIETAPQVRLRVIDTGPVGDAPTLVLVPGWGMSADIWREQIDTFRKQRRVVSFDPRSQGDSSKMLEGNTPEMRARDLHALLAALGLKRIVLVGWSQGVQDVAAYVEQFGTASLAGVVLVDAPVSAGAQSVQAQPEAVAQELERMAIYGAHPEAYARGMLQAIIRRPLPKQDFDRLVADLLKTPTSIGQSMLLADLFGVDRTPALVKLDKPTLVIAAASSPEFDAQKAMAAKLPRGRFETIENAGHAVFVDQPQRFDALLGRFLGELDQRRAECAAPGTLSRCRPAARRASLRPTW